MLTGEQIKAAEGSPLFKGLKRSEISLFLSEIKVFPVKTQKNEVLIAQGERRSAIHIMLSGEAVGERLGAEGYATVINEFCAGSLFGDMLSGGEEKSPVAVRMISDGEVLKIPFSSLLMQREGFSSTREVVLRNLFREISEKYFSLMRRVDMLLCPTLRGKIALYILEQAGEERGFASPHSRERQAEILSCDRSALSRELSRMKREGIISVCKARFEILDRERLERLAAGEKEKSQK